MLRLLQMCCNSCISKSCMKLPHLAPARLPQSRQWTLVPLLLPVRPVCRVGKLLAPAAPAAMQWMTRQQINMFQMAWQGSLAPLGRAAACSTQGTAELRNIRSTTGAAGLLTTVPGPTQSPLLACICVQACEQTASSPTGSTQMSSLAVCAPANRKTLGEGNPRAAALEPRRGKLLMQKVILIELHAH